MLSKLFLFHFVFWTTLLTLIFVANIRAAETRSTNNRYNILFIAVDDLRPELGCYGADHIRSPNIDRLSAAGRRFSHHYVQVPTCGASRYALLTGRRASESNGYSNYSFSQGKSALKQEISENGAQTFPELFRRSGYHTAMIGKISHQPDGRVYNYNGTGDGLPELPNAWDELLTPYGSWKYSWATFFAYADGYSRESTTGTQKNPLLYRNLLYQNPDVSDQELPDGMMADQAIKTLNRLTGSEKPFFLAVGFYKPHLPFVSPKKYWDMYENIEIPLPPKEKPETVYGHKSGEFFRYQASFPKQVPLSPSDTKNVKRAYAACVSYVDAQIGRVLDTLKKSGKDRQTIVVLWGDHGWHLGEHQVWGKQTPLEPALRSPLIISVPDMNQPGVATEALVESVDIFPTLVDLCQPSYRKTQYQQGGQSFTAVLNDPGLNGKESAFGYVGANVQTLRTPEYRLIVRKNAENRFTNIELYDHRNDPGETKNIAPQQVDQVEQLLEKLK
ncbi:MAG: sulfatase [Planctomycetaceae bacterium]|jgi:arylsulfatase A-like enzyme|nr:sulfatase [Planctomycetaceae bacterium]